MGDIPAAMDLYKEAGTHKYPPPLVDVSTYPTPPPLLCDPTHPRLICTNAPPPPLAQKNAGGWDTPPLSRLPLAI
jgi:hypothetical protein